jgi:RNA recognition motif-containing protein
LFSEYAEVRYVNLPRNRETGDIKGFAFVDVGSDEEIPKVVDALNGKQMGERPMRVSRSLEKDQIRSTKNTIEGAKKLYVGNLPFVSTKEEIEEFFSAYGEVKDVFVPVNKYGESRGFGFISIKEEDVEGLIEATNGLEFMGRMITVNHPMPPGSKKGKRGKSFRVIKKNLNFHPVYLCALFFTFCRKTRQDETFCWQSFFLYIR